MPIYAEQLWPFMLVAALPALAGIVWFVWFGKERLGLGLVVLSALLVRLVMISSDPFLQDWDERFHALVAKHMMDNPFVPMLRLTPILPYDPAAWCCNHIWVHKQPLFLWQMALSMKVFGVSEFAMRLPSAVMGAVQVLLVFNIAKCWLKDGRVAFLAAVLSAFAFYQIELSTGRYSVDHNDVAFTFYLTAGIWAFTRYLRAGHAMKWAVITGALVGCAILIKWLTALLIFGGWGLYILLSPELRNDIKQYAKLALAVLIATAIFLPWQIYIMQAFPVESAAMHAENHKHITEVLGGHFGSAFFYLNRLQMQYGLLCIPFLIIGICFVIFSKKYLRPLTFAFLSMILVIFAFFSLFVATKMIAFTYPVAVLAISLISLGIMHLFDLLTRRVASQPLRSRLLLIVVCVAAIYALNPRSLLHHRSSDNPQRNAEINNAMVYKKLHDAIPDDLRIINCKSFEDVEVMFYTDFDAYHWWPEEHVLDSLQNLGYRFAAFASHTEQYLPEHITRDTSIIIIEEVLQ